MTALYTVRRHLTKWRQEPNSLRGKYIRTLSVSCFVLFIFFWPFNSSLWWKCWTLYYRNTKDPRATVWLLQTSHCSSLCSCSLVFGGGFFFSIIEVKGNSFWPFPRIDKLLFEQLTITWLLWRYRNMSGNTYFDDTVVLYSAHWLWAPRKDDCREAETFGLCSHLGQKDTNVQNMTGMIAL